ncbi:MAG: PQQ-binding-like beta-propeller repeat protein, partial [Tepidisphaeraceae bacterium]
MIRRVLAFVAFAMLTCSAAAQEPADWPHWRGPADNGSTETGTYPVKWDATSGVHWKVTLPGKGCSTPIVCRQRIYVTGPAEGKDALLALDWSGNQLWQTTFGAERKGKNPAGSGSNSSPTTDGQAIFVYYKSGTLARVELDGKVTWKTNVLDRFGRDTFYWDMGTSPVLTQKYLVVAMMHHGESYLAAFDKVTGELSWKVSRNYQ